MLRGKTRFLSGMHLEIHSNESCAEKQVYKCGDFLEIAKPESEYNAKNLEKEGPDSIFAGNNTVENEEYRNKTRLDYK